MGSLPAVASPVGATPPGAETRIRRRRTTGDQTLCVASESGVELHLIGEWWLLVTGFGRPGRLYSCQVRHGETEVREPAAFRAAFLEHRWVVCVVIACILAGCGRRGVVADEDESRAQQALKTVSAAYTACLAKKGKPPASVEELKPFLPADAAPEELLRSPRDGQPFVILWGTDPRKGMDVKPLVIAYEAQGKGGIRMVFTAMGVFAMDASRFAEARFPEGHSP